MVAEEPEPVAKPCAARDGACAPPLNQRDDDHLRCSAPGVPSGRVRPVPSRPGRYLSSLLILAPSRLRLAIRPCSPNTKPITGSLMLLVSISPVTPILTSATEPSTPTSQPSL